MTAVHSAHIAEYASVQKCVLLLLSRFLSLFLFHVKTLRGRLSKISFEQKSFAILLNEMLTVNGLGQKSDVGREKRGGKSRGTIKGQGKSVMSVDKMSTLAYSIYSGHFDKN